MPGICRAGRGTSAEGNTMAPIRSLLTLLLVAAGVWGQGTIMVTRTAPNPIANFDLSYIDITGRGAGPTLFQLQVVPESPTGASQTFYIRFVARCRCASFPDGLLLLESETGRFTMPPERRLSSNEFFADQGDSSAGLHTTIESLDPAMRETLLSAGVLPPGRVTLDFELFAMQRTGQAVRVSTAQTWFDIVAVRYVKLVTPGIEIGAQPDQIPRTFTPYPQFVWSSDLQPINYPPGSVKFVIEVYENPGNRYPPDDIADSRPVWSDTIPGESNVNYAQYPVSGARALAPGQTYYWRIAAVLQGPVNRDLSSELYAFRVADMRTAGTLSPTQSMILRYLAMILGPNYGYVVDELRSMSPDETVLVDGKQVGVEELARIAEEFVLGERTVSHVEIE